MELEDLSANKRKIKYKRGLDQNDLIFFGLRRESIQVEEEERRGEEKWKRKKKEEPRKVWNLYKKAMILYGNYLGKDFYGL